MRSNKTVVLFLFKFFGVYILLFLFYSFYLNKNQQTDGGFSCAPITQRVAEQTNYLLNVFGYNTKIEQHDQEVSIKLFFNDKIVARIIEGCNSISVIILFISFIVAFSSTFKDTALYVLFGSLMIYFTNIARIGVIAVALYKYPHNEKVLHDVFFPSVIYGMTFLLWVFWVRTFSKLKE